MQLQHTIHLGAACVTSWLIYLSQNDIIQSLCVCAWVFDIRAICRLFPTFVLTHMKKKVGEFALERRHQLTG